MKEIVEVGAAGLSALLVLLAVYFGLLTLVSGWQFTLEEFQRYAPFIVALALGFGVQVSLYAYLRRSINRGGVNGKVVTASATAMLSCCTYYLVNLLPILGASGLVIFVSQYQVDLYWIGLAFNAAGIAFVGAKVAAVYRENSRCPVSA